MQRALNGEDLRKALADADLRVLTMVLFHGTGDRRWLSPPYQPRRDVALIAAEDAGFSPAVPQEIRDAAFAMLSDPGFAPKIEDPGNELMLEMMSVCLGEQVSQEYAPMMREELGFTSRDAEWSGERPAAASAKQVFIVGAGASGIALAARLEHLDIAYTIAERHDEVGGTWHENRYPGCGVDTPNHAYSFSFGTRYRWSRYFAPREQLQDYMERSADEFGVRPHVRFGTSVTRARWDEARRRWQIDLETPDGKETVEADFLVSAIGQFGLPSIPEIEGAERFDGPLFHSTHWPQDLELRGKHIALIGTGATSMQLAPAIIDEVASLSIYQRGKQWARPIPRYHDPISEGGQWLLEFVPGYAEWFRLTMLWRYGDGLLPYLHKDPDWPHPERSLNRVNDRHRQEMTDHIHAELGERHDLIDACLPDYPPYGKRILLDNGWYKTITRPNAELITDAISHIDERGIVTRDGTHRAADAIVLATGFQMTQMTSRIDVCGRAGKRLDEFWGDDNATAYLGISVPGFPNLFIMQGPNAGLGHGGSAIFQSECQARYITAMILRMLEQGVAAADVRMERHDDYVARVDAEHEDMIWTHPGVSTYYRNRHGRVVSVSPWRLVDYWAMTHDPTLDDYELTPSRQP